MREITKKERSLLLRTLNHLDAQYSHFSYFGVDIEGDFTNSNSPQIDYLSFSFPSEDEHYFVEIDQFLKLAPEILSIDVVNKGLIKTKSTRYYIVSPNDSYHEYILRNYYDLKAVSEQGAELNLVVDSLIVGLAATGLDVHDEDFWGTYSPYLAIKVTYFNPRKALPSDQELDMVRAYIFDIADTTGIALQFSEISIPFFDYGDCDEEESESEQSQSNYEEELKYVEPYNEGMRLFVSAIQIQEAELKFLNFYKILEHFAPVVVNIDAHELMREKLKVAKRNLENGDYIKSVFDLAKSVRSRFNDEELIKSTFNVCFDFIDHFEDLPDSIKKKVYSAIGEKQLSSSTEPQKLKVASNMVGKIIYNTRNKVVHAKSNFKPSENICDSSDLEDMNLFMKRVCSNAIRWYNKQPQHLKLAIIN